jgi:hypothetical protein
MSTKRWTQTTLDGKVPDRVRPGHVSFKARFSGHCKVCGGPVRVGTLVVKAQGGPGVIHDQCH